MAKRFFDIVLLLPSLLILCPILLLGYFFASVDTKSNGLFCQKRVGKGGKLFTIFKFKTMQTHTKKISSIGNFLRKTKIDEVPQLINVLKGDMSFVGPRPDVEGYYDKLEGENRKILELKPGITSLASIKYSNEEELLKMVNNPIEYNDEVIFPDKVKMNLDYYYNKSMVVDLKIIFLTIIKVVTSINKKQ